MKNKSKVVYAIRVMTTKKGKPRKRKAYAKWTGQDKSTYCWKIVIGLARLLARDTRPAFIATELGIENTVQYHCRKLPAILGCKCKVVAIELREVECECV